MYLIGLCYYLINTYCTAYMKMLFFSWQICFRFWSTVQAEWLKAEMLTRVQPSYADTEHHWKVYIVTLVDTPTNADRNYSLLRPFCSFLLSVSIQWSLVQAVTHQNYKITPLYSLSLTPHNSPFSLAAFGVSLSIFHYLSPSCSSTFSFDYYGIHTPLKHYHHDPQVPCCT